MEDSEKSAAHRDLRPVSEDEVQAFLRAKTKGDECFSCGSNSWIFDGGSQDIYRGWPWGRAHEHSKLRRMISTDIGVAVPVLVMTCGNCGFQRAHDLNIVLDWLKSNPLATEDET